MKKINIILFCFILLICSIGYADPATPTDLHSTLPPPPHVIIELWFEVELPLNIGDTVRIHGEVYGGEGQVLLYQWQYSIDKEEWFDIEDATEPIYEFIITEENAMYHYRLKVAHYWAGGI